MPQVCVDLEGLEAATGFVWGSGEITGSWWGWRGLTINKGSRSETTTDRWKFCSFCFKRLPNSISCNKPCPGNKPKPIICTVVYSHSRLRSRASANQYAFLLLSQQSCSRLSSSWLSWASCSPMCCCSPGKNRPLPVAVSESPSGPSAKAPGWQSGIRNKGQQNLPKPEKQRND